MKATARYGQWLGDVALAKTGALEGVWALALRNGLSVTSELTTGQELEWQPEDVEDSGVANIYRTEKIEPATGAREEDIRALLAEPAADPDNDRIEEDPAEEPNTASRVFNNIFDKQFS